jgi:hypothetical protein
MKDIRINKNTVIRLFDNPGQQRNYHSIKGKKMNNESEEEDKPLTIEQSLRIELAWRTLERDRALAEVTVLRRRLA